MQFSNHRSRAARGSIVYLAVDAIAMRDYPLIQAYVVWMAIIYVMVNLITDLLYHALDPRIRLGVSEV